MREKIYDTGDDDDRVYPTWYRAVMSGEFDHLLPFLDPTKAAVDVGALLGTYSLTLSSLATRCLCVEPLENYAFLAKVLPGNCIVRTVAAGDRAGEGVLRTPDWGFGLSSLLDNEWLSAAKQIQEQRTRIMKLDDIVAETMPESPIGFVKIDVEGYELEVVKGAADLLRHHRPNLQIEILPEHVVGVRDYLQTLGYAGLFFFNGAAHQLSRFAPEVHQNRDHRWTIEKAEPSDAELYVANFFFVPVERGESKAWASSGSSGRCPAGS